MMHQKSVLLRLLITAVFFTETVTIEASASDPDGSVACVKFYDGSVFWEVTVLPRTVINGLA